VEGNACQAEVIALPCRRSYQTIQIACRRTPTTSLRRPASTAVHALRRRTRRPSSPSRFSLAQRGCSSKFERRKARLAAAGWFDAERKRPLPHYPRAIGIVTSPHAAALRDILATLRRRWPAALVFLYPTAVQGEAASNAIAFTIRTASDRAETDVLIVARGGGSIEDLWAFNEEVVARAVYESRIPIVTGIGHETDFTICDFVADVRAPTPTGAAMLVVPDRRAVSETLGGLEVRWRRAVVNSLEARIQRVDVLARRLVHPAARLAQQRARIDALGGRLARAHRHRLTSAASTIADRGERFARLLRQPMWQTARVAALPEALARAVTRKLQHSLARVAALEQNLAHLNPTAVLQRGYAIVTTADGAIVHDAAHLTIGDSLDLAFARGTAGAKVTRTS